MGGLVPDEEGDGRAARAHDDDVVDAHAHVLGVVQGGYAHVAGLPRQKTAKRLQDTDETIKPTGFQSGTDT